MATFMERLSFLQKVPTLMKATADDDTPCPGYLFQDIGKISHESSGCGQCLLEYLLERLQVESCHVKLKVLKIFVHLCGHGSNHFLTELRRNSTFIQQASVYSGPPDPIHGTGLYQKVRNTAQEVARLLFTDTISTKDGVSPLHLAPPTMGMGSTTFHRSGMQGFGYSPGKQGTGGGDSLLDKIQKAAEVVASAVLPPTEHQGIRLHDNHYRAVLAPSAPIEVAVPACAYNVPARTPKAPRVLTAAWTQRCPGQVGGGWEETDSGNSSSHNSSQDTAAHSRASVGSKSAGSQSGASRESSGDPSERVEALQLGDCGQEMALISRLTEGSRVFLSREESQHFTKECSILNCEVVLDLLSSRLLDPSNTVKMRALCGVSCLLTSDLLSLEQMFGATQRRLRPLSEGTPGPVANKATKILRQFEALMGGSVRALRADTASSSRQATANLLATSAHLDPLLPNHSAGDPNDTSPTGVTRPPNHPSPEELPPTLHRLTQTQSEPDGSSPGPAGPRGGRARPGRLSLFSGMELVTTGRPLCTKEAPQTAQGAGEAPSVCGSECSQPASAFSFLNF
ncbi:tepsin [Pungitius sinensis]